MIPPPMTTARACVGSVMPCSSRRPVVVPSLSSEIQREIEDVEVAETTIGGEAAYGPVDHQRDLLLGDPAVRAERRVEAGEIVEMGAGPDDRRALGDYDQVADTIGRQLEPLAGRLPFEHDFDAGHAGDPRADRRCLR